MASWQLQIIKYEDGKYMVSPRYKGPFIECNNFSGVVYEMMNFSPEVYDGDVSIHTDGLSEKEDIFVREFGALLHVVDWMTRESILNQFGRGKSLEDSVRRTVDV